MSQTTEVPTFGVALPERPPTKFEREKAAFFRLLPELLATHLGQYVAIHDERVVDSGPDQLEVAMRVRKLVGTVALFVHLVSVEPPRIERSGVLRDLSRWTGGE